MSDGNTIWWQMIELTNRATVIAYMEPNYDYAYKM